MTRTTEKLSKLVTFRTGKLDSNAAKPGGEYPFFTCSRETLRTDTCSFDCECVLLAGNNAEGVYPIKYFSGKFDAYQRTYVIRTSDPNKLSNRYLYYALQPKLNLLKSISTGVATKFLTLTILNDLEVEVPSTLTQRNIVGILSAYDDLVENNTRRIKTLEEMAQALYREWFVHFRFPGHERVKMVPSPLGLLPEGWSIARLGAIVECRRDSTEPGEHLCARQYLPIECIASKSLVLPESKPWQEAQSSLQLFETDDILFGAMRPYFHKVVLAPFPGITRSTCFVLRPFRKTDLSYALLTLFREETVGYANAHSRGTTIPYAVWRGSLEEMLTVLPPERLRTQFDELLRPVLGIFKLMFLRQHNLRRTRDLLLPKLISGEIDVSNLDIR